jgi:predicted nucleic acid-binding protein
MFLIDTNIWLERLLDQEASKEVANFLERFTSDQFIITDFSLHSIGVICNHLHKEKQFLQFVEDILIQGEITLGSLAPVEMERVVAVIKKYKLDFDDAYQYAAAEKYSALLVSFDSDFDKTELGKKKPAELL